MPAAVAVTVAVPVSGFPEASFPLQTTKVESQTPPQTSPEGATVTRFGFEELNVNVAGTPVAVESAAETLSCATCPDTIDTDTGVRLTTATVFLLDEPPPQPAMATAMRTSDAFRATNHCIQRLRVIVEGKRILQSSFWNAIVQQEKTEMVECASGSRQDAGPPRQRTDTAMFFARYFWPAQGLRLICWFQGFIC